VPVSGAVPGPASGAKPAVPELTRPWWETDQGEVGMRMRGQR
jgi:putative copper resistance protein D